MLLSICLIFCQFQPGVGYKSVAYVKKSVFMPEWTFPHLLFQPPHPLLKLNQCIKLSIPSVAKYDETVYLNLR